MSKAGGVIGIIAGVFGVIAALITLFVGGVGAAFDAKDAGTVVGLGWGGVAFSFLAIVFGAVVFARPKGAGLGLIVVSLLGAVLGGTMVAVCMVLALVGGILAMVGAKGQSVSVTNGGQSGVLATAGAGLGNVTSAPPADRKKKGLGLGVWLLIGVVAIAAALMLVGKSNNNSAKPTDPLAELVGAAPSALRPEGELSEMFSFGSKNTDLQRENKLKEITGQVVEWTLPVYEVKRSGAAYKVQTSTKVGIFGDSLLGAFVYITPRSAEDQQVIESLKTGDVITFKGRIAGVSLRSLDIKPAILSKKGATASAAAPEKPAISEPQPVSEKVAEPVQAEAPKNAPADTVQPQAVNTDAAMSPVAAVGQTVDFAPSFDCAKASSGSERLICSNQKLSELDVELMQAYKQLLSISSDKDSLRKEQNAWRRKDRDSCSAADCMTRVYQARIDELNASTRYLSKPAEFR